MRLFVAVPLPAGIQDHLAGLQGRIPSSESIARIVPARDFHLTLKFIGEWPDERVDEVKRKLALVQFEPFDATLAGIGTFPSEQRVNVVWVGLAPEAPVLALQQAVDAALAPLLPASSEFKAHLTLCRVKSISDKAAFLASLKTLKPEPLHFPVREFQLIKSTLTPDGPVYETLAAYPAA
jgi:2'-5' RNA ligase